MNKLLLFLILLPKKLWAWTGADIVQLKAILKVKLMMDDRRPLRPGKQQSKKKPTKYASFVSVILSAAMGIMYTMPLMMVEDTIMGIWLYCSSFLLMLSFMLISDFSTVLFDTKDKNIILPRPINERTLLLSRLLHMFIYLFRIVVPMSLAGWIILGMEKGWLAALWFPFILLMLTIIALFIVNGVYLLILRLAHPGKFKDIINYFQIGVSMLVFACIYLMPRAVNTEGFAELKHNAYPWAVLTPSYWLAASWSWIEADKLSAATKWISILSFLGPLALAWLTIKYLSPSFAQRIGNIDNVNTEEQPISENKTTQKKKSQFYLKLANWFNKNPLSKAGFCIAWLQTDRSRNFKMRVYPMFAFVPVYFIYIITMNHNVSLVETWEKLSSSKSYILLLYMTAFVVTNLMTMLVASDQYKASWIYYSSPISQPGYVMSGAFKGLWIKYFIPMYSIVACFILFIWGKHVIIDIILAFVNITVFALGILLISLRRLPFSSTEKMNEKGTRVMKSIFVMLLPMSFGFGHYWVCAVPWLWWMKLLFLALSSILVWLLWDSYQQTSWAQVKKTDLD
jgi:ABC-2 type transport system permease protein